MAKFEGKWKVICGSFGGYYYGDILTAEQLKAIALTEENLDSRIALGAVEPYNEDEPITENEDPHNTTENEDSHDTTEKVTSPPKSGGVQGGNSDSSNDKTTKTTTVVVTEGKKLE